MSNKIALDALTAAKTQLEILLPDYGRVHDETAALEKIDAAIAALQAAEPQGWMPIETAPKDGTSVLVFRAGDVLPDIAFCDAAGRWRWSTNGAWAGNPSLWMPLPTPPKD